MHCPATGILPVQHHWILQCPVCRKFPVSASETAPGCMAIGIVCVLSLCSFLSVSPALGRTPWFTRNPCLDFYWALHVLWNVWGILSLKPVFPSCWCHLLLDLGSNRGRFERRSRGVPAQGKDPSVSFLTLTQSCSTSHTCAPTDSQAPAGTDPAELLRAENAVKKTQSRKIPTQKNPNPEKSQIQKNSTAGIFVHRADL